MKIDFESIGKELSKLEKLQDKAIQEKDYFKLAACFIKLSEIYKRDAESLQKIGQNLLNNNIEVLMKDEKT